MPSLNRAMSWPAGKMNYNSNKLADNDQSRDLKDQIAHMSDRPSTWLRAPAPSRFVRKQNKVDLKSPSMASEDIEQACDPNTSATVDNTSATVDIDAEMWTFAKNRNSTGRAHTLSTQSQYYLAHRQHVAGELTKAETVSPSPSDLCSELWDGFLRVLSV
jgi:hypothetical protein